MTRYRKTRVNAQDMRTGQYADLSQLIRDGYYPNLLVLPENYEPPLRSGPSIALPIEPIYNFSPPSIADNNFIVMNNLFDITTGAAIPMPWSNGSVGNFAVSSVSTITGTSSTGSVGAIGLVTFNGASSVGSTGTITFAVSQSMTGNSSAGSVATLNGFETALVGLSSTGNIGTIEVPITMPMTGISSTGSVGIIPAGSGWGEGGSWSSGTWGTV